MGEEKEGVLSQNDIMDSHYSPLWCRWSGLVPGLVTLGLKWPMGPMWHLLNPLSLLSTSLASLWSICEFLGILLTTRVLGSGRKRMLWAFLPRHFPAALLSYCPGHTDSGFVSSSAKRLTCSSRLCLGNGGPGPLPQMFSGSFHTYLKVSTVSPLALGFIPGVENKDMQV